MAFPTSRIHWKKKWHFLKIRDIKYLISRLCILWYRNIWRQKNLSKWLLMKFWRVEMRKSKKKIFKWEGSNKALFKLMSSKKKDKLCEIFVQMCFICLIYTHYESWLGPKKNQNYLCSKCWFLNHWKLVIAQICIT